MKEICSVPMCNSKRGVSKNIHFHEFPVSEIREQWIENIRRATSTKDVSLWEPKDKSYLCSLHFQPTDYKNDMKSARLNKTAVPTVFPNFSPYLQSELLHKSKKLGILRKEETATKKLKKSKKNSSVLDVFENIANVGDSSRIEEVSIERQSGNNFLHSEESCTEFKSEDNHVETAMHLEHYRYFLASKCAHCSSLLQPDNKITKIKVNGKSATNNCRWEEQLTNLEAIADIYGISQKVLADKFLSYFQTTSEVDKSFPVRSSFVVVNNDNFIESTNNYLAFCQRCGLLFSEMYRASIQFRNVSDKNSLLSYTLNDQFGFDTEEAITKKCPDDYGVKCETTYFPEDNFLEDPLMIDQDNLQEYFKESCPEVDCPRTAKSNSPKPAEFASIDHFNSATKPDESNSDIIISHNQCSQSVTRTQTNADIDMCDRKLVLVVEKLPDVKVNAFLYPPTNSTTLSNRAEHEARMNLQSVNANTRRKVTISDEDYSSASDENFSDFQNSTSEDEFHHAEQDKITRTKKGKGCRTGYGNLFRKISSEGVDKNNTRKSLFECNQCHERFRSNRKVQLHVLNHVIEDNDLETCEEKFDKLPYKCPKCKMTYKIIQNLKTHCAVSHRLKIIPLDSSGNSFQQKRYTCSECSASFNHKPYLKAHQMKHLSSNHIYSENILGPPYNCPKCDAVFNDLLALKLHCGQEHSLIIGKRPNMQLPGDCDYNCTECNLTLNNSVEFREHQRDVHNVMYSCQFCDEKFKFRQHLKTHQNTEHPLRINRLILAETEEGDEDQNYCTEPYFCRTCNSSFKSRNHFGHHNRNTHSLPLGNFDYHCQVCMDNFSNSFDLLRHLYTIHSVICQPEYYSDSFKCAECEIAPFYFYKDLRKHQVKFSHKKIRITCAFCEEYFDSFTGMKMHKMSTHPKGMVATEGKRRTDVRKKTLDFKCPFCDQVFPSRKKRSEHGLTHPKEEQTYKCPQCPQQFTTHAGRKMHTSDMHEKKFFECTECGKKIEGLFRFRRHCRIHGEIASGIQLCDLCGKSFSRKKYLSKHKAQYHLRKGSTPCPICGLLCLSKTKYKYHMAVHDRNGAIRKRKTVT